MPPKPIDPEMLEVVVCPVCREKEYQGMIHWKSGKIMCRRCIYQLWVNEFWRPVAGVDHTFPLYDDGIDHTA